MMLPPARTQKWLRILALASALTCACRAPVPPAKPKPAESAHASELPGHFAVLPSAATATSALPKATTLASSVELADMNTATDGQPFGFDDVPWLLDRAGAWLRAHYAAGKKQPTLWQRRDVHGWETDVMEWRPEGFVLRTQGDDTTVLLSEAGCSVRVASASAKCEPDLLAQATMAAIMTGLAWPDGPGRAEWSVEAMHTSRGNHAYLRLALAKFHLRFDVDLTVDGAVGALRALNVRLQPDPDGMAFTRADRSGWHWAVQSPGIAPATERNFLRLDNSAGVDVTIDAWMAAAKARGLVAVGPFEAQVDVRDDGLRVRALQAPVLATPDASAWKGVQVVAVAPTAVETSFECLRKNFEAALRTHAKPGCHIAQALGIGKSTSPAVNGDARMEDPIVVAVRACP